MSSNAEALLPTILKQLNNIQKKPSSVASSIFSAIRKASYHARTYTFLTPLLPPLTSISLTLSSSTLRFDAAATCVVLLNAFISRKVSLVAEAYAYDLVDLARSLLVEGNTICILARFAQHVHVSAESISPRPVVIKPSSLPSLLFLLARFIPSSAQLPQCISASTSFFDSPSTKLWFGIGAGARASIFNLVLSETLLSARCGSTVAISTAYVWERALASSSASLVPQPLRKRLCALLITILKEQSPTLTENAQLYIMLYRICMLSSPNGKIPAELWATCGLRQAAMSTELAKYLRTISAKHLVESTPIVSTTRLPSSEEPPSKRPRLSSPTQTASNRTMESLGEPEESPSAALNTTLPYIELQSHLQSLENIYIFTENAEKMNAFVRAVSLTADSLGNVFINGASVQHWLSFGFFLSEMLRDLAPSIRASSTPELWKSAIGLSEAALRLLRIMRAIHIVGKERLWPSSEFDPPRVYESITLIFGAIICIIRTASEALLTQPQFPTDRFAGLCRKFGEAALENGVAVPKDPALPEACGNLHSYLLGSGVPEPEAKAHLFRGVFALCRAFSRTECIEKLTVPVLSKVCDVIAKNTRSTPFLTSSALHALCDIVCALSGCKMVHGNAFERDSAMSDSSLQMMEESIWDACFEMVKKILVDATVSDSFIAGTQCMGVLAVHAPESRITHGLPALLSAFFGEHSTAARRVAHSFLSDLLVYHSPSRLGTRPQSCNAATDSNAITPNSLSHQDDTWDGPECLFSNPDDPSDVHEIIAADFSEKLHIRDKANGELARSRFPMSDIVELYTLILRFPSVDSFTSKLLGIASGELLAMAAVEVCKQRPPLLRIEALKLREKLPVLNNLLVAVAWRAPQCSADDLNSDREIRSAMVRSASSLKNQRSLSSQAAADSLSTFFLDTVPYWLPRILNQLLQDDDFSSACIDIITNGDADLFWNQISRSAVGVLLRKGDMQLLNAFSSKVKQPVSKLVDRVCSDAFARAAMNLSGDKELSAFEDLKRIVAHSLRQPIEEILAKRSGKVVQRLVMELGGRKDSSARRGLNNFSEMLKQNGRIGKKEQDCVSMLVAKHFMLVMDAVQRGLFHSKATISERLRYLRMLDSILSLSHKHLHQFVPKILATLKMALDTDHSHAEFQLRTLHLWITLIRTLGTERLGSFLGFIFSVLLPLYSENHGLLAPMVADIMQNVASVPRAQQSEILILLRAACHADLKAIASRLEVALGEDTKNHGSLTGLLKLSRTVVSMIQKYENGVIEVAVARHLLRTLRTSRRIMEEGRHILIENDESEPSNEECCLPLIASCLVDHLNNSRNPNCQEVLLQCIGEVGAINPSFVSGASASSARQKITKQRSKIDPHYPTVPQGYVALLLDEFLVPALAKGGQSSLGSSRQNRIGLVIQELLRACGCNLDTPSRASKTDRKPEDGPVVWSNVIVGDTDNQNGIFFWENLRNTTRTVAQPYLSEPFDVQRYKGVFGGLSAGDAQLACQPVFSRISAVTGSGTVPTAQEWRRQMIVQLVDFIGNQGKFGKYLKALRPILRYEDSVAAFVFPLVIFTALDIEHGKNSKDIQNFLIQELSVVLSMGTAPQPVFDLFDTLRKWRDERCEEEGKRNYKKALHSTGRVAPGQRVILEAFTEKAMDSDSLSHFVDLSGRVAKDLSLLMQAQTALSARSYSRAVMLAECHIRNQRKSNNFGVWPSFISKLVSGERFNEHDVTLESAALGVLQTAFAQLEDADSMSGISALRVSSSLAESVLDSEAAGRYNEALLTYERALGVLPRSSQFHQGFLSCLMTLGHWESMLSHAEGLISSLKVTEDSLLETAKANGIAAAWRLGRWEKVQNLTTQTSVEFSIRRLEDGPSMWISEHNVCLGKMFLGLRTSDAALVSKAASEARKCILGPTLKAAREGYARTYPMISMLHSLSDVEDAACLLHSHVDTMNETFVEIASLPRLMEQSGRSQTASVSLRVREPIISAKRAALELSQLPREASLVSLDLAKLAKESDNLQAALAAAHRALSGASQDSDVLHASAMEMAHIQRAMGDFAGALSGVKKEIDRLEAGEAQGSSSGSRQVYREQLCEALVVAGSWVSESKSEPSDSILSYFQRAAAKGPNREEPFYALGRHYDSLLQAGENWEQGVALATTSSSSNRGSRRGTSKGKHHCRYVPLVIRSFGRALQNGHTRIFEALPRMLTVWFDYNTEIDSGTDQEATTVEGEVRKEMKNAFDKVGAHMWMTAVPQLLSRVCHPRKQVREEVMHQLARLTSQYPDQCSWTILPGSQLKTADRRRAVETILRTAVSLVKKGKNSDNREVYRAFRSKMQVAIKAMQLFINICERQLSKEHRGRRENCAREFDGIKKLFSESAELCPIVPSLNSLSVRLGRCTVGGEGPFSRDPVRIASIEDWVLVMSSLMRPRRIGLIGSDGKVYRYLAKKENSGDMRKDSRLVELICVVNRLLAKEGRSMTKLALKTYAVLPLCEESGMIEWVNNLTPISSVVREQHLSFGVVRDQGMIQRAYNQHGKKSFLVDWALKKYPAVMHRFFMQEFRDDAQHWLAARRVWTESTAVWSMVGYIVGLGDRHGENVLIETTSGRCVHVDFAMLFDKGIKLTVPEVVPFRLTQNMVSAMGISGYEGVFRKVSERVLGMLRGKTEAILGVLESFLHDPLADWGRSDTRGGRNGVISTKEAWQTRGAVKAKLMGMVDNSRLPLSIQGQVQRVIGEATSIDNLSKMYLWWSAWI